MAIRQRRKRRISVNPFRLRKTPWVDPFPHIAGTEPEKRIFAALWDRKIFFIFQGQVPELERGLYVTAAKPYFKPDFVIPHYKVIIDPFSPFHHSLEEAVDRDAEKIAMYSALGYSYYHPWALAPGVFLLDQNLWGRRRVMRQGWPSWKLINRGDLSGIKGSANDVISAIKELHGPVKRELTAKQKRLARNPGYELGPNVGLGATSVAAANRRRTKPKPVSIATGTRRNKKRRPL